MSILIKGGIVVNAYGSERADVLVKDGVIAAVGQDIASEGAEVIDASGECCYVLPGFIDTHTHFDLPLGDISTADDFITGGRAAVLGGVTTVLDFATQERDGTLSEALKVWHDKAKGCSTNYGFHMAIARWDEGVRREMEDMTREGVTSYKMYMVYDALKVDDGQIYSALKEAQKYGALIGVHCENWEVLQQRIKELYEKGVTEPCGHPLSRPNAVEAEAVARLMRIGELAEAPVYVVHLSTREGLMEAERARERGQEVYLETCPQYLLLTDERYNDPDGVKFIMSPPLRSEADNEALWAALKAGGIDTIGTDHCSFTMAQKTVSGGFKSVPNGGAGVQHRAQLIYTYGVLDEISLSMEDMVRYLSYNPAKLFGMQGRGEIAAGCAADIVVWDGLYASRITDTEHAHNCDISTFAGFGVNGRARDVLLNGLHVVKDGKLIMEGKGKYIHRTGYTKLR